MFNDDEARYKVKQITGKIQTGEDSMGTGKFNDACTQDCCFVNLSSTTLYVVNRLGAVAKLEPYHKGPYIDSLLCKLEMRNYPAGLRVPHGHENEMNQTLRNNITTNGGCAVAMEELISVDEIVRNRSGIYVRNFDIYVTQSEEQAFSYNHPNCPQKIHNDYLKLGLDVAAENVVQIGIRIVDNEGVIGRRFTVIHDQVMEIIPVTRPEIDSGLYITGFNALTSPHSSGIREDNFYTFEEVKEGKAPVELFKTFLEAKDHIDAKSGSKEDLERLEKETARKHDKEMAELKRRLEREKADIETERRKAQERLTRLEEDMAYNKYDRDDKAGEAKFIREMLAMLQKMEAERAKAEQEHRKAEADRKAHHQKMIVETVKTVGILVTAGLTIYSIAQKRPPTKKEMDVAAGVMKQFM